MRDRSIFVLLTVLAAAAAPATAMARPGGWDGPGWGQSRWDRPGWDSARPTPRSLESRRSDEGRVQVARFVAEGDAAQALGHGAIAVASGTQGQDYVPQGNRAAYEAAVVDQLVHAGYDTTQTGQSAGQAGGQLAELTVTRTVLQPAEAKRSPVSGEAAVSVGNRGTAYGLAVNVDLSKPLPPLVSTKLEARIRDRATNTVLWEGRAEVATREGDDKWGEQAIAARLAEALFDGFPRASDSPKLGG
ncbi:hypothetical protein [Novosphingobium sp. JCM 18896]|uniref:hypothetical protein n=1 Tax=Novosphingobium sp. JCM 18896 TaxID=2989731 RepID=UPI002223DA6A|nr:hypothetical protein [Novosphingobium sp. JCM 18896]MCW1429607.1 hypothetical protein [Novosphingobium sp. JCM 18896]